MMQHSENHSIKYHEQKFCIKFAFQGRIEQDYLSKHVKMSISGVSINLPIPVLNLVLNQQKN